jgi:putative ABC transport system permease protein
MAGPNRPPWGDNPELTLEEANVVEQLPSVGSVTPFTGTGATIHFGGRSASETTIMGVGAEWATYRRPDFIAGRNWLPADVDRSGEVVVLSETLAEQLFEHRQPVGERVRILGTQFTVVGVYKPQPSLFDGSAQKEAVVPISTAIKHLPVDTEQMEFWVVPATGYTQADAMDEATATLRSFRRLGPAEENNFALLRQEALKESIDSIVGMLTMVMMVLSSIGLMVGGIGVIGIMMISVTERTREIGVRKALGATRREILWQFLVEAVTVTVIGGTIGMAIGAGLAMLIKAATPLPASVPLWAVLSALGMSAFTGILFGLYPANKAARLDPVEALRYE